ncbi:clavesin-2-like [Aricia agestis]|uniref:clavesin-2-like n=1 Tax=Aricia agestis TaxID=91739 RepID=UPI001C2078A4|nr:clavesin-2-like [Aricia agestis]
MNEYAEYDWKLYQMQNDRLCDGLARKRLSEGDKQRALDALKEAVDSSLNLALRDKSRCQDDNFLRRFLYARKHDVQQSFELLVRYHQHRREHPELWASPDGGVLRALTDGLPGVLEQRDRRGRCVLLMFASNWLPHACPLVSVFRALLLTIERTLADIQNQSNGYVIIVDWTEFTFKQSCSLQAKVLKMMIDCLQDCMPVRFKSIHFIGQPWYVETALAVIKPYLRAKTRERIVLHGNNLSTLHDALPLDILPAELGGEGPSYNSERWVQEFCRCDGTDVKPSLPVVITAPPPDNDMPKAKLDKAYKQKDNPNFSFNGMEKSAKSELLRDKD